MRNVQKVLIGIFLSGVLLGGIGTGIAVAEFSSLSYGGRKIIGEENLTTKELDFEIPMDGRTVILGHYGYRGGWKSSLVEDPSVPAGIVRYEITYNERTIEPNLYYEEYEQEEPEEFQETAKELDEALGEDALMTEEEDLVNGEELSETEPAWEGETEEETEAEIETEPETDEEKTEPVYAGELYLETRYKGDDFEIFMENKDRILEELKQGNLSSYEILYVTEITVRVNPETRPYVKDRFFSR